MPPKKKVKPRTRAPRAGPAAPPADSRTAAIYAMMAEADHLYKLGRYRRAMALCQQLARLDPSNAMPEQMIEGCRRELRTRKTVLIAVLAALVVVIVAVFLVYSRLRLLRISPEPGVLRLRERETQSFVFQSPLGYHRSLEYTWRLLDADGHPVPLTEEGTRVQHDTSPWECAYTPPYSLVRSGAGGRPVVRKIVASCHSASGSEVAHAEWVVEVSNVAIRPRVLAVQPRTEERLSIVVGQGERTFRVEAADGDGGAALVYEWSVGQKPAHRGGEPAWTYRPPADALPAGRTGREVSYDPPLLLACRVSNAHGEPMPVTAQWQLRLVRSNAPPQIIAFEPELSDLVRIKEGETRTVTVKPYDPDEAETLSCTWELDGAVVSQQPSCTLSFPHGFTDSEKTVPLSLTVSDSCGAKVTRSWEVRVVDAPRPASPP
ncbi:MAG TPA: hypothetical protein VNE39_05160 [Planctomycetota bacterium]|nr:hypothetical protein [Planctomycetota bacterium]